MTLVTVTLDADDDNDFDYDGIMTTTSAAPLTAQLTLLSAACYFSYGREPVPLLKPGALGRDGNATRRLARGFVLASKDTSKQAQGFRNALLLRASVELGGLCVTIYSLNRYKATV